MSLVAYCASDESDAEEPEEQTSNNANPSGVDAISDDEDEKPSQSSQTPVTDEGTATLLKGLPAPREDSTPDVEEELEDLVKPKQAEMLNAPKPPKRSGQPVKISIPALQQFQDSDDEDESPPKNKPKASGKCGLIGLLPPPQYGSRKEANRPLVPHTLTKKRPAPPSAKPSPKPTSSKPTPPSLTGKRPAPLSGVVYSDSDEDEDGSERNFFSLDSAPSAKLLKVDLNADVAPVGPSLPPQGLQMETGQEDGEESQTKASAHPVLQDAPLQFGKTTISAGPTSLSAYSSLSGRLAYMSGQSSLPAYHVSGSQVPPAGQEQTPEPSETLSQPYPSFSEEDTADDNVGDLMQDEQFRRMQGKKSRGKEEIHIIDANMDEFVTSATVEMAKNLTEETSYQSHRKSDHLPTATQRRKKQITYLAFQARERELELKNAWAQNRVTKRQTQSKYGF